jgi:ACS family hexuronate transporter-like MFS transporter
LLLLATLINYMDRLTLNQTARRIKDNLLLSNEQYGQIEAVFGVAFATGALVFGWSADRYNVRGLYALALFAWSMAGFATGFAQSFLGLLVCRFCLGLFEAGNWPCALRTTQRILPSGERTLGNSILQSGAALGAILTPLLVELLGAGAGGRWLGGLFGLNDQPRGEHFTLWSLSPTAAFPGNVPWAGLFLNSTAGTWRFPFLAIGALGSLWVILWLISVRRCDLTITEWSDRETRRLDGENLPESVIRLFWNPRFAVLVVLVVVINLTWHFFRVWLPLYLGVNHHYSDTEVNYFMAAYYTAADAGSLAAGLVTLMLVRCGWTIHGSRQLVFFLCAALTLVSLAVALVPTGPGLLALLLILGFGALGLFPVYYSLSQELTVRHQGKLTGVLGCITWLATALMHPLVGRWIDQTRNYSAVVALAGLFPMIGWIFLLCLWGKDHQRA